jgi:hypothetical protein
MLSDRALAEIVAARAAAAGLEAISPGIRYRAHQVPNSRGVVELLPQSAVYKQNGSSRVAVHRQRRRAGSSNSAQFAAFNTTLITCLHSDGNGNRKD